MFWIFFENKALYIIFREERKKESSQKCIYTGHTQAPKLCNAMHMTSREMLGALAYPQPQPNDSNRRHMLHYKSTISSSLSAPCKIDNRHIIQSG